MYKFNLNHDIYFELTEQGKARLSDPYFAASVHYDQDKRLYRTQAWVFCNLFGESLQMGFEHDIFMNVYFDKKDIEEQA
ncbi:MAG: hypothetical protein M0Q16_06890 [Candidatus Cloacimonetes bacterium]|nr:hypothetical protein [Candidatus Cloacimonadota bacterium]